MSLDPGEDGQKVVVVVGVDGDNSLTKDNREGEANPWSISSPAARTREFDQAATKPPLLPLAVGLSDSMLATESPSDCLSTLGC